MEPYARSERSGEAASEERTPSELPVASLRMGHRGALVNAAAHKDATEA
jgi:hypothetical protein